MLSWVTAIVALTQTFNPYDPNVDPHSLVAVVTFKS